MGEMASEITSTVSSLLGEVNQHILALPTASAPSYPKRPHGTALVAGLPVDACRWALSALSHFDVILELSCAGVGGEKARLNLVSFYAAAKGSRSGLSPSHVPRFRSQLWNSCVAR